MSRVKPQPFPGSERFLSEMLTINVKNGSDGRMFCLSVSHPLSSCAPFLVALWSKQSSWWLHVAIISLFLPQIRASHHLLATQICVALSLLSFGATYSKPVCLGKCNLSAGFSHSSLELVGVPIVRHITGP